MDDYQELVEMVKGMVAAETARDPTAGAKPPPQGALPKPVQANPSSGQRRPDGRQLSRETWFKPRAYSGRC